MPKSRVAVVKTEPATVLSDFRWVMHLAGYREVLDPSIPLLLKLNLSWTKYFPACSSQPWQVEGVARTLLEDGYPAAGVIPVENKTVVTDPWKGAANNRWLQVLQGLGLQY